MNIYHSTTLKLSAMATATGLALLAASTAFAADPVNTPQEFNAHINIVSSSTCGIEVEPATNNSFQAVMDVNVASGTTHYTTIPAKNADDMLTVVKATGGANCDLNSGMEVNARATNSAAATNGSVSNMALGEGVIAAAFTPTYAQPYDTVDAPITSGWQVTWGANVRGDAPTTVDLLAQTAPSAIATGNPGWGTNLPSSMNGAACGTTPGGAACFGTLETNMSATGAGILTRSMDRRWVEQGGHAHLTIAPKDGSSTKAKWMKLGFAGVIAPYPTTTTGDKDLTLVRDGSQGKLDYTVDITLV